MTTIAPSPLPEEQNEETSKLDRYVNRYQGVISLYVNGILLAKKRFRDRKQRSKIMKDWTVASKTFNTKGPIYMDLRHYDVCRKEEVNGETKKVGRPKKVEPPSNENRPIAKYSNMRLYDELN